MDNDLESLYKEAQSALKAKEFDRASELLRQILKTDVDYKDTAQLLARVIKLSRRRWYNDPRLWGALGVLLLVGLGIYLFPKLRGLTSRPAPTTTIILPTGTPSPTIAPPATATLTETLTPTSTPVPLTWKRIYVGQEFPRDTIISALIDENDSDVMYVGTKNAGVYKSIDGGVSWQPDHDLDIAQELASRVFTFPEYREVTQTITIATENGDDYQYRIYHELGGTLQFSKDGKKWEEHEYHCTHLFKQTPILAYVFCNGRLYTLPGLKQVGTMISMEKALAVAVTSQSQDVILVSGLEGLFVTKNHGVSWETQTNGLGSTIIELKISPQGLFFAQDSPTEIALPGVFAHDCNLYRSPDKGHTWMMIHQGTGQSCGLSFDSDGSTLYWNAFYGDGHSTKFLQRSIDDGASWQTWGGYRQSDAGQFEFIVVVPHPKDNAIFYTPLGEELFVTLDNQKTWTTPLKRFGENPAPMARLYFDHQDGSEVYLVFINEEYEGGLFRSTDFGENWERCSGTLSPSLSDTRMVIDPRDSSHLLVATHGEGVLVSKDACQSWQASNTGLGNLFVNTIALDPKYPDTIYAGTEDGAYISFDSGETWNPINDGLLGATVVYSIAIDPESNVYAATPYGIFKLESK